MVDSTVKVLVHALDSKIRGECQGDKDHRLTSRNRGGVDSSKCIN